MSAKLTSRRWEGTSSIHTDKPLACLTYLIRLWVTKLPSLWVWERNTTKGIYSGFHWFQKVTKEAKDSSSLLKVLITIFESPLRIIEEKPSPCVKRSAPNCCQSFNIVWRGGERDFLRTRSKNNFPAIPNHSNKTCFISIPKNHFIKIDFKIRSSRKLKKKDLVKYDPIIIIYKNKNFM